MLYRRFENFQVSQLPWESQICNSKPRKPSNIKVAQLFGAQLHGGVAVDSVLRPGHQPMCASIDGQGVLLHAGDHHPLLRARLHHAHRLLGHLLEAVGEQDARRGESRQSAAAKEIHPQGGEDGGGGAARLCHLLAALAAGRALLVLLPHFGRSEYNLSLR